MPVTKVDKGELETNIDSDAENQPQRVSNQSLAAFGVAITLHSFIDGLAIGVFNELGAITVLAISVVIHKVPVACSVGTTFLSHNLKWNQIGSLLTFICFILASPIGMITGMILGKQETNMGLISIQAISGGTFIYLAACDLLIHEFHSKSSNNTKNLTELQLDELNRKEKLMAFYKFLAVVFGASIVIILVSIADPHSH